VRSGKKNRKSMSILRPGREKLYPMLMKGDSNEGRKIQEMRRPRSSATRA
jgi:hypothetical protein